MIGIGDELLTPKESYVINMSLIPILKQIDDARKAFSLGDHIKARWLLIDAMHKIRSKYRELVSTALSNLKKKMKKKTKRSATSQKKHIGAIDILSLMRNKWNAFIKGIKNKFVFLKKGVKNIAQKIKAATLSPIKRIGSTLKKYIIYIVIAVVGVGGFLLWKLIGGLND